MLDMLDDPRTSEYRRPRFRQRSAARSKAGASSCCAPRGPWPPA